MIPGIKKRVFNFHDVLMYVAIARKHLRLMSLLMCLAVVAALTYYSYARPVYFTKALVRVESTPLPLDTEKIYRDGRLAATVREMTSPFMIERVARKFGAKGDARMIKLKHLPKLSVRSNPEKNLNVEVYAITPQWANNFAEVLLREYLSYREEKRIKDRQQIVDAYLKEIEQVTGRLNENLETRFDRKDEQDVTKTLIELNQVKSLPSELVRLARRIDEMGRVRVRLQDPELDVVAKLALIAGLQEEPALSVGHQVKMTVGTEQAAPEEPANAPGSAAATPDVVVVPSMVNSADPWEDLDKARTQIKQQMQELSKMFLPGHHRMLALRKQLDEVNQRLNVELQVAENRFGLEYQDLINKRSELEAKLPDYEEITKKSAKIKQDATLFEVAQLPWRKYYAEMKKKIEALDFAGDKERVELEFLGLVETRERPISPNRTRILMMALVLGGILALGVPFLIEYLDHTLSNLEQAESTFQLRGLGIVPKLANEENAANALLSTDNQGENNLIENFRVIRTNLLSMGAVTKSPHVLMITSAMPREGKTVVSSNLAISFAQTGAKTLLIDTDLRRGRLHRLFGYRKSPGLSNVLMGECTLEDALRPTTHDGLTILSAGKHLDTGTELLGSKVFADMMVDLRRRYDRIVVDTPPVLGLSETSVMQNYVDGVLFVIWSGHTPIRDMKAAIEMLQANGANFYGFVLNRLDLNATTNYYQYYYYSHDYYYHRHALENA